MQINHLNLIVPSIEDNPLNEVETLGAAVWLWMHSGMHKGIPLEALNALLLPAIKAKQFLLAFEGDRAVAYVAWAKLNENTEAAYLRSSMQIPNVSDWSSGDRVWFTDWIAPFGHTQTLHHICTHRLFTNMIARSLYHKGESKGLKVMPFHGISVLASEAKHWFDHHPVKGLDTTITNNNTHPQGTHP